MENAAQKKKEREQEQLLQKENLSLQLSKYGGLWDSEEDVVKNLQLLKTEGEKRLALKVQLNFRNVLLTKCEKSPFHLSSGGKMKPVNEIRDNLFKIIKWSIPEDTNELDNNFSVIIGEDVLENQKLKSAELAKKERQKESQPTVSSRVSPPPPGCLKEKNHPPPNFSHPWVPRILIPPPQVKFF